jgi:hypothetical protein
MKNISKFSSIIVPCMPCYQNYLRFAKVAINPLVQTAAATNTAPPLGSGTCQSIPIRNPTKPSYKQSREINLSLFQIPCIAIPSRRNKPHFPPLTFLLALNKPEFGEPVHLFSI